jgi:hypothetical protein
VLLGKNNQSGGNLRGWGRNIYEKKKIWEFDTICM